MGYFALKVPWSVLAAFVAFSFWWDALVCITHPFLSSSGGVATFGLPQVFVPNGSFSGGQSGFFHEVGLVIVGCVFLFAAPWVMRGFRQRRPLARPRPARARPRGLPRALLEQARTQTVDASAATLRRIERDLHDGTQAQLVALAMRLGMAKEKLEDPEHVDLDAGPRARRRGAPGRQGGHRRAARHRPRDPPARARHRPGGRAGHAGRAQRRPDRGVLRPARRPTPAIEAIAYFCVAELLANVAQHAQASRASVSCAEQGTWLRLVVRDDGRGGAQLSTLGSTSSGLAGLTDRVHAVDGRLNLVSPPGGPTVVTVDLPLSA